MKHSDGKYRDFGLLKIVIPVAIVTIIAVALVVICSLPHDTNVKEEYTSQVDPNDPINRVINFAELQAANPEIFAWIYIPGTNVDYPILQHPAEEDFYLTHDMYGKSDIWGSLYIQNCNRKDFSDPVTMIYGHCAVNDYMLSTLHRFRDKAFFDTNRYMYIYTPEKNYKLLTISAYEWGDRHVIKNRNLFNESVRQSYFDYVLAPESNSVNVLEGVKLTTQDRIVQLSTCLDPYISSNRRYLVTGQFIEEVQPSK